MPNLLNEADTCAPVTISLHPSATATQAITVPAMTSARFDDLLRCRLLLEPDAARLALDFVDRQRLKLLKEIDARMDLALKTGDVNVYMEGNFNFHFELYRAQGMNTLNQLIQTLWLQFGPYMRVVYGRFGTAQLVDQHHVALAAIEAGDREALGERRDEPLAHVLDEDDRRCVERSHARREVRGSISAR